MISIWGTVAIGSILSSIIYYISKQFCADAMTTVIETSDRHLTLRSDELKSSILIIGDIHGCLDELNDLLRQSKYDSINMTVILVGDLVNKGPYSAEVIRFARTNGFYSVLGNHDVSGIKQYQALQRGEEIPQKYDWVRSISPEDFQWFSNLPYTISLPDYNTLVVHAGLIPNKDLHLQSVEHMTKMRNIYSGRLGFEGLERNTKGDNWAHFWTKLPHVYYGHDAKRGFQSHAFATGLDTGCCCGRSLTGIILPSKTLVEVVARKVYEDKEEKKKNKHK